MRYRIRRFRDRQGRTYRRQRAADLILDDRRRWQNAHNRRTCEAIAALPTCQPHRKETGQ
ncbi:hypothetical protein ACIQMY_25510 [Streptomyces sp. NPDC091368]|uniref:hypothetical protein n=1 Tax=Streptomyces sp. NPDC091368 TaxID=3365993 RepID=UPI00380E3230